MPKHKKRILAYASLVSLMVFLLFIVLAFISCATLSKFLSHQETFDLTIGTKTYMVVLPQDFPDMKDAISSGERCWDIMVCYKEFCLSKEKFHDHIHFWYAPGEKPVAIIWIKTQETDPDKKYKLWIYVEDVPFAVDLQRMNDFLREKFMPKRKILYEIHF